MLCGVSPRIWAAQDNSLGSGMPLPKQHKVEEETKDPGAPQLSLAEVSPHVRVGDLQALSLPIWDREPVAPTRLGSALLEGPWFIFHQSHYFPPVLVLRTPACPSPIAVGPVSNPRCLNTSKCEVACPLTGAQWVWLSVLSVCFLHSQHTALPIPAWGVLVSTVTVQWSPRALAF